MEGGLGRWGNMGGSCGCCGRVESGRRKHRDSTGV